MASVFISYAREDEAVALRVFKDLEAHGHNPWLDRKRLLAGDRWELSIRNAIKNSSHIIVLISVHSTNKKGFVQKEMLYALETYKTLPLDTVFLIPARIDETRPRLPELQELQWVDLYPDYESGLRMILESLDADLDQREVVWRRQQPGINIMPPEKQIDAKGISDIRPWIVIFLRAIVILTLLVIVALATVQPVELFIFRRPIEDRIHEEGIRKEVVRRKQRLEEAKYRARGISLEEIQARVENSSEYNHLEAALADVEAARSEIEEIATEISRIEAQLEVLVAASEARRRSVQDLEQEIVGLKGIQEVNQIRIETLRQDLVLAEKEQSIRAAKFLDATERISQKSKTEDSFLKDELVRARSSYDAATKTVENLESTIQDLDKSEDIEESNVRLVNLRKKANEDYGALEGARMRYQNLLDRKSESKIRLEKAGATEEDARREVASRRISIENEVLRLKKQGAAEILRLRRWIRQLHVKKDATEVPIEPWPFDDPPWSYFKEEYDFFERLRVLSDLRNGRLPRWPEIPEEAKALLIEEYGLESVAKLGVEATQRRMAEVRQFQYTYYAIYLAVVGIPVLLLTLKLLKLPRLRAKT